MPEDEKELEEKIKAASEGIPEIGKVGREMETIGILPIPNKMRNMSYASLFIFWAMASASAATPLAGLLVYGVGIPYFIVIILLSTIIGIIPAGLFSEIGRQKPIVSLVQARGTFGYYPANALSMLYTIVNMGWFGLNLAVGAQILSATSGLSFVLWAIILGILQIILVMFGAKWLNYFYKYTAPLLVISYAILTYYLFSAFHPDLNKLLQPSSPINWGLDMDLILSFSILSWSYKITTVTRFAKPYNGRSVAYFLSPGLGIMLPVLLMGILGYISQATTGNWNLAAIYRPGDPVWVIFAAIGASIAIIHTNAMNLYPAVADLLVAVEVFFKRIKSYKISQPISTLSLGVISTILAILGILNYVENFLLLVGDVIFPFTFILIVDYYFSLRNAPITVFYKATKSIGWNGIIALAIGVALNYYDVFGAVSNYFPYQVLGSLISALIYYLLLRIRGHDILKIKVRQ
ncbi:thiamine permease [Sulfolobus sp. A20]|uniref:purine-cytosine permease family protein n=1 Tax=Sulfolobaceae TaxID=118883 RepID=UPI000845FF44|nr:MULTISPECIES: cytosine permease [unclassified Sulfolobus]TRM75697.1 thiamine permease [Sulfolobus sp. E5]TRM76373.1 thiamine permease [Sulfolobus sp. A20-N-F8]TRM77219.1 thiamine permease [Sulfolobus sp. B5]TRM88009.1 thiamine permease [Sulfolobus sp. E3]TRM89488.1 thiamine permease [Sulfolobus sp. C3]TRM93286.1 thiamine permease [Sulfolobus sp. A20-N-G8]TRN00968.1 thiamine permease [Sulfolobus sp. E1]TRN03201.1 thiamine permease [Sulfolobus sp. F1]